MSLGSSIHSPIHRLRPTTTSSMSLPSRCVLFSLVVLLLQFAQFSPVTAIEYTTDGIAIVGSTELLNINVTAGNSRQDYISYEFASYISVHFADFNLPDGDSVVVSSPDDNSSVSHTYTGRGRDQTGTFIASFVTGNSVTVTYNSVGAASAGQGYRVTGYSRGYPTMQEESICGDGDQSLPAKCYAPATNLSEDLPLAYKRAQAVARLLINGTYLCTGWLGGSKGHVFTNQHCFDNDDWVHSTDIEFGAESSGCSVQCATVLGCPGAVVATTSTLVTISEDIDYALLQLPDCVDLSPYGYLQLRETGPVVNESIYVAGYPGGHAKRIVSTVDSGANTTIRSVGEDGDCGKDQVGHDADTEGGSSGSPLIASDDNLVVAIHHCGGCTNTAVDVRTVLEDLASKNISIQNLVATTSNDLPAYAQTPCAAQNPANSADVAQNRTMPCGNMTASEPKATKSGVASTPTLITTAPAPTTPIASKSTPAITAATASKGSPLAMSNSGKSPAAKTAPILAATSRSTSTKGGISTDTKASKGVPAISTTPAKATKSSTVPAASVAPATTAATSGTTSTISPTPAPTTTSDHSSTTEPTPVPTTRAPASSRTSPCTPTPSYPVAKRAVAATPAPSTPSPSTTSSPRSTPATAPSTDASPATSSPTPTATTVDVNTIVAKLKAAVDDLSPTPSSTISAVSTITTTSLDDRVRQN